MTKEQYISTLTPEILRLTTDACKSCNGSGYTIVKIKEENYDYETEKARECECVRIRKLKAMGLEERYQECCLANYNVDDSNKDVYSTIKLFIDKYPNVKNGILIMGGCGTGKTYTAATIINEAVWKTQTSHARMISVPKLLEEIKATYDSKAKRKLREMEFDLTEIEKCELLCIDDLGAEHLKEGDGASWIREKLFLIIDSFWNRKKTIIVTTNCTVKDIEDKYGDRVMDRIRGMTVQRVITGKSRRML